MEISSSHIKKVKRRDKIARWCISLGGISIILSVVAILVLIVSVTLPLFVPAKAKVQTQFAPSVSGILALGVNNTLEKGYAIDKRGRMIFFDLQNKKIEKILPLSPTGFQKNQRIVSIENRGQHRFNLLWENGTITSLKIKFRLNFPKDKKRQILYEVHRKTPKIPRAKSLPLWAFFRQKERGWLVVRAFSKKIQILEKTTTGTEEKTGEKLWSQEVKIGEKLTTLVLDKEGQYLYGGTERGRLLRWDLSVPGKAKELDRIQATGGDDAITALHLLLGQISLAVGTSRGDLSIWFPVRKGKGEKKLQRIHNLKNHSSAITFIEPSYRNKCLLSLSQKGKAHLDHSTSENHLLAFQTTYPLARVALSTNGHALLGLDSRGTLLLWKIDNPHPEVSWTTLFGKVWYESYDKPGYTWQSSSGSDDFEPKFSLVPLIFGTFKGTFYAMIFALPLALFGAIYTSQFASSRHRQWIKNTVEVMAAVPSVVIGFLIGLWMAPLVESWLVALFMWILFFPLIFFLFLWIWQKKGKPEKSRGREFLFLIPLILASALVAALVGSMMDSYFFQSQFKTWLYTGLGIHYDQRNCIIIAFGLGFAVIPIIFSISEDGLSAVPPSLSAASLAMGASRWQTVRRVILPAASPAIFAATMIGFGRAIGETMIVLMATGNTPIMDGSIFNGMRTLSANIAVEIPEAPVGGSLYRILFLCAVVLFGMTFLFNTVAEIVRERLRKKYSRF